MLIQIFLLTVIFLTIGFVFASFGLSLPLLRFFFFFLIGLVVSNHTSKHVYRKGLLVSIALTFVLSISLLIFSALFIPTYEELKINNPSTSQENINNFISSQYMSLLTNWANKLPFFISIVLPSNSAFTLLGIALRKKLK